MIYPQALVFLFLINPTLLSSTEVTPPSQKDTKKALQTVGKFLKDDGGTNWLAGLATNRAVPLTTEELMKEILNSTKADEAVKSAANVVKLALEEQKHGGANNSEVIEFEGWRGLLDHVEDQDDIICLYRKSTNVSSERSKDWQKFLKNVSSGYTIYLALDMGQKYAICLKKIDLPNSNSIQAPTITNPSTEFVVSSTENSIALPKDRVISNGSRALIGGARMKFEDPDNDDKCEHDEENGGRYYARSKPHNARRQFIPKDLSHEDSPCNRPIIYVLPPNYMLPMGSYSPPMWPGGVPSGSGHLPAFYKPPLTPYYQPQTIFNQQRTPISLQRSWNRPPMQQHPPPAGRFVPYLDRSLGPSRNDLTNVLRRAGQRQQPQDKKTDSKKKKSNPWITRPEDYPRPSYYPGQALGSNYHQPGPRASFPSIPSPGRRQGPRYMPQTVLRPSPWQLSPQLPQPYVQSPRLYRPVLNFPPRPVTSQLLWPQQLEYGRRPSDFTMNPSLMSGSGWPATFYRSNPAFGFGSSTLPNQNCMACISPCDRPILLKILVENASKDPLNVRAIAEGMMSGRRNMEGSEFDNEIPENKQQDSESVNGDVSEGSGDKIVENADDATVENNDLRSRVDKLNEK